MAKEKTAKLSPIGLALGVGVFWGLSSVLFGWGAMFGWGNQFVQNMSSVYMGYEPSFIGGIVGGIWGFIGGFISGGVVAFFYNMFKK